MSDFKKKLLHDVVNPSKDSSRVATVTGEVTKSKNSNKCKVNFIDKDGNSHKNETLRIRMYGNTVWCPKEGDKVIIEQDENDFEVVAQYIEDYTQYQEDTILTADIYSNYISDSMPGSIY